MKKIIIFLLILSLLVAVWIYQRNRYSKGVLQFEILGPKKVELLEEVTYLVRYKNEGNFALKDVKAVFECPEHSLYCKIEGKDESPEEEKRLRKEIFIGSLYPKQEGSFEIKTRLLGKEKEIKKAKATFSFKPKNLKVTHSSFTTFTSQIEKVPLTFNFNLPSSLEASHKIDFSLDYFSTLDYPLFDIGIKIKYPQGFQFLEGSPKTLGENYFEINSLNPGYGGKIKVKGILDGEVGEKKIFTATFGVWKEGEYIPLKEVTKAVEIIKVSLYVSQLINGKKDYIANLGEMLHYEIYFRNFASQPFRKLTLLCKLKGELFEPSSVTIQSGSFNPSSNIILWTWKDTSQLEFLPPGEEEKIEFWVKLKDAPPKSTENLMISDEIFFNQESAVEFFTKVNSKLVLSQTGKIQDSFFHSPGPLPPVPNEKSYYTIFWTAENLYNPVADIKVKARLSPLAEITKNIYPQDAIFTYSSSTKEIAWEVGELNPGQKAQLVFQVVFDSSLSATTSTSVPSVLISKAEISGRDEWTNQEISSFSFPLSTFLTILPMDEVMIE